MGFCSIVEKQYQRERQAGYKGHRTSLFIPVAEYERLLAQQDSKCGICSRELAPPHIDHDHKTGKLRGLLCFNCNVGLGHFQDSPELLAKAMAYLLR